MSETYKLKDGEFNDHTLNGECYFGIIKCSIICKSKQSIVSSCYGLSTDPYTFQRKFIIKTIELIATSHTCVLALAHFTAL